MKLAMMRRIAHHTSGEAKPLTPVQDHALCVFATSVAPLFKRNSDTSTHATLRTSCSQGLPKPEGRFCIRFSSARSNRRNQFSNCGESVATGLWPVSILLLACSRKEDGPQGRGYKNASLELIGV